MLHNWLYYYFLLYQMEVFSTTLKPSSNKRTLQMRARTCKQTVVQS
jgi:hypothetical protein